MVKERRAARRRISARSQKKAGSIWDTPRMQQVLRLPPGSHFELTKAEARAIFTDMLENPPPFDENKWRRIDREMKQIRRMWGSIERDV